MPRRVSFRYRGKKFQKLKQQQAEVASFKEVRKAARRVEPCPNSRDRTPGSSFSLSILAADPPPSPGCAVRAVHCPFQVQQVRRRCTSAGSQANPRVAGGWFLTAAPVAPLPPSRSTKLFCRLTGCLIEMKETAVVRHSEGKKFLLEMGARPPHLWGNLRRTNLLASCSPSHSTHRPAPPCVAPRRPREEGGGPQGGARPGLCEARGEGGKAAGGGAGQGAQGRRGGGRRRGRRERQRWGGAPPARLPAARREAPRGAAHALPALRRLFATTFVMAARLHSSLSGRRGGPGDVGSARARDRL